MSLRAERGNPRVARRLLRREERPLRNDKILFPINVRNQSIACDLKGLSIATVDQPEIALINNCKEITGLSLNGLRRPGRSLRLEAG